MPATTLKTWDDRLQQLIEAKDTDAAIDGECWHITDNTLVIFNVIDGIPDWLSELESKRDDNGNTE